MNIEKLKRLQAQVRIGGKGTPRRKKKVMHQTAATDDKKLQSSLKKLSVSTIPGIEEVNIIKDDLTVIHFNNPKAQASLSANTFAVTGHGETKKIVEMLPEILPQLGQETVVQLRMFANSMTNNQKRGIDEFESKSLGNVEEDDVPLLVGDFDEIAKQEDSKKAKTRPNKDKMLNTEKENPSHITCSKVETKKQNMKKNSNENSNDNTKKVETSKTPLAKEDEGLKKNENLNETTEYKIDSKTIEIKANIEEDSATKTMNKDKNYSNNLTPIENIAKSNPAQCLNLSEDPLLRVISNEEILSLTDHNERNSESVSDNKIKSLPLFGSSSQEKSEDENKNTQLIEKRLEHPQLESINQFVDGSSSTNILPTIEKEVINKELKEENSTYSFGILADNEQIVQSAVNEPLTHASLIRNNLDENKIENQQEIQAAAIPADSIINLKNKIDVKESQTDIGYSASVISSDNTKQKSTEVTNVAISSPAVLNIKYGLDMTALPLSSMESKKAAQVELQPATTISSKIPCSENNENTQNLHIDVCKDFQNVNVSSTCYSSEEQVDIAIKLSGSLPEIGKMQKKQELGKLENDKIDVLTMTLEKNIQGIDQTILLDENRIQSEDKSKQALGVNVNLKKKNNVNLNTKAVVQSSTLKKDVTNKDAIKQQPASPINSKKSDNASKLKPTKSITTPQSLSGAAPMKHQTPKPEADTLSKQEKSIMTGAKQALPTPAKPQIAATPKTPTILKPKKVISQSSTDHPGKVNTAVKAPSSVNQNSTSPSKLRTENNNLKGKKTKAQAEVVDTAIKQTQQNKSGQQKLTEDPTRAKGSEAANKSTQQSKPAQQKIKEDKIKTQVPATDSPSALSKS